MVRTVLGGNKIVMVAVKLKMVAIAVVFCFAPLIVLLADSVIKKPENVRKSIVDEHFTVEYPKYVFWVGVLDCVAALVVLLVFVVNGETPVRAHVYMLSGIVLFFWFGTYILIEARTSKTVVYYGLITVYRPLRKRFSFTFSDVVSAKLKSKKLYYGTEERIIVITKSGMKMSIGSIEMQYERFGRLIKTNVPNELLTGFD